MEDSKPQVSALNVDWRRLEWLLLYVAMLLESRMEKPDAFRVGPLYAEFTASLDRQAAQE